MSDYDFTEDDEPAFGEEDADGDEDELLFGSEDEDLVLDEDF